MAVKKNSEVWRFTKCLRLFFHTTNIKKANKKLINKNTNTLFQKLLFIFRYKLQMIRGAKISIGANN